jgi:hypothetical protein
MRKSRRANSQGGGGGQATLRSWRLPTVVPGQTLQRVGWIEPTGFARARPDRRLRRNPPLRAGAA